MLLSHSNIGITMNLYVHTAEEEKKSKDLQEEIEEMKLGIVIARPIS